MILKRYMNEILVVLSLLLLGGAYYYKDLQVTKQEKEVSNVKKSLGSLKEIVALENIWDTKRVAKKVESIHQTISASKVKWVKKQNKVTAVYKELTSNELNKLVTRVLNTAVVITLLDIEKSDETYNVEFKCEW